MIVSRFAPSPSGRLHLGHAYSAVIGHGRARESGGSFLLRIEDLDQTRCKPEFVGGIFEDLRWLGLDWDDPVLVQSQRTAAYEAAVDELKERGLAYACLPRVALRPIAEPMVGEGDRHHRLAHHDEPR